MAKTTKNNNERPEEYNYSTAYQSVVDFNKVIISISSSILAVLISYLVLNNSVDDLHNLISPFVLTISIIFSLFGFGYALPAIRKNKSEIVAVRLSNIGAGLMILGIILITTIELKKQNIDGIIKEIENSFQKKSDVIDMKNCESIVFQKNNIQFNFKKDSTKIEVNYSPEKKKITSFKKRDFKSK